MSCNANIFRIVYSLTQYWRKQPQHCKYVNPGMVISVLVYCDSLIVCITDYYTFPLVNISGTTVLIIVRTSPIRIMLCIS